MAAGVEVRFASRNSLNLGSDCHADTRRLKLCCSNFFVAAVVDHFRLLMAFLSFNERLNSNLKFTTEDVEENDEMLKKDLPLR